MNTDDLYAIPNKRKQGDGEDKVYEIGSGDEEDEEKGKKEETDGIERKDGNKDLPSGWEKHEGNTELIGYVVRFVFFYYLSQYFR